MAHFDPDAPSSADAGIFGLGRTEEESQVVLVPVPFEATVSYGGGAANGPQLILDASRQVDLFDLETGRPYEVGIYMRPIPLHIYELSAAAKEDAARGDEEKVHAAGEEVNRF